MPFKTRHTISSQEWIRLEKREENFIKKQARKVPLPVFQKLDRIVPEKLHYTLDSAFHKAFGMIFEKGAGIIEKTYDKEQYIFNYQINEYAVGLKETKKTIKAFSKQANTSRNKNLLISSVEGIGLGALGIGLPDIPLFVGILFKSIYEIALSYGFSYDTESEQCFILKIIQASMEHGDIFKASNKQLNDFLERDIVLPDTKDEQIMKTSAAISSELLYMKFIQGIPVIGIAGGLSDSVYLKKITDYAHLKYKRRFLWKKIKKDA